MASHAVYMQVLGIAQDAGYPQINCKKECCTPFHKGQKERERVTCMGIVDRKSKKSWLIEATPDIISQWKSLQESCEECQISGILITHAHIGHYTGLMQLGREAMGANTIPVYVMPRMKEFLETNGPWSQLVALKNIDLRLLHSETEVQLSENVSIVPLLVPHRDEFSETVGFEVKGPDKKALFIPDIDKWEKWHYSILQKVKETDHLLIDGTFYDTDELPGRDMSEIPHPFIEESVKLFSHLNDEEKNKICFIHLNHSNPLIQNMSEKKIFVEKSGFNIAFDGRQFPL